MQFGSVAVEDAEGVILAHSLQRPDLSLKKGQRITADLVSALRAAGVREIIAARLERGDVGEDEAAAALAGRLAGPHVRVTAAFTGRCNLIAAEAGVVTIDIAAIDRLNDIDEAMTVATLAPWRRLRKGEMIATVKVIPFAVPGESFARALAALQGPALGVAPFALRRVGAVSTLLPGLKRETVAKTLRNLEARLDGAGARLTQCVEVPHEVAPLAAAIGDVARGCDIVVVFGASATVDRRDTVPVALEAAGGRIEHFGMPVDPGNLLVIGACGGRPVIGAPGCARSIAQNGFDMALNRLLAGLAVTSADIRRMGVGGLLGEIAARPQPRASRPEQPKREEPLASSSIAAAFAAR